MVDKLFDIVRGKIVSVLYFLRFFVRNFYIMRGIQTASSLAYTTLLSIVPIIFVMFGLFSEIAIFKDISISIQNFIFTNFVPYFGEKIQNHINYFSSNVSKLTLTGAIPLILLAIMLLSTISDAFDRIWLVTKKRNFVTRLLVYWSILTMWPLLIGVGFSSTSYLLSLSVFADNTLNLKTNILTYLPFLTTSMAFAILYILVPNCYINKPHAIFAGIICAILFEIAKYGFSLYVYAVPSYENIYGAISIIPLFLIWLYISWVIVLCGAHLTFCLSSFSLKDEIKHKSKRPWVFSDVLHVLELLFKAQQKGHIMTMGKLGKQSVMLAHYQVYDLLKYLRASNWVKQGSNDEWLLAKDMSEYCLFDLYKILPVRLPLTKNEFAVSELSKKLKIRLASSTEELEKKMSISIYDFFKT